MANQNTSPNKSHGHIPAWLALLIVVVIAIIAWLIVVSIDEQSELSENGDAAATTARVEQEPILSYVGTIAATGDNQLTIEVLAERNPTKQDKTVQVMIAESTILSHLTIPRQRPTEGSASTAGPERISLGDLNIGDTITIVADHDIRNVAEFTAARIEVRTIE